MTDNQKKVLIIVVAVLALGAAGFSAFNSIGGEKEQIVGTLPMPEGGGRDAEKGRGAPDLSGMPSELQGNPGGEGKQ